MWKAASHTFKVRKGPVAPLEMQPRDRVGKETVKAFGPSLPKIAMGIGHVPLSEVQAAPSQRPLNLSPLARTA
jgi:hypothetical protein